MPITTAIPQGITSQPIGSTVVNPIPRVPSPPPVSVPPIAVAAPVAAAVAAAPPLAVAAAVVGALAIAAAGWAYLDLQDALKNEKAARDNDARVSARPVNTGSKRQVSPPPFTGGQSDGVRYSLTYTRTTIKSPDSSRIGEVVHETRVDIGNTVFGAVTGIEAGVFDNYSNFRVFHKNGVHIARSGGGMFRYDFYGITEYAFSNIAFTREDGQADVGGDPLGTVGDVIPSGYSGDRTREQRPKVPPPQIPNQPPSPYRDASKVALGIGTEVSPKVRTGTPSDDAKDDRKSLAPSPVRTPSPTPTTPKAPSQSPEKDREKEKAPFIPPSPDKKIDDIAKDLTGLGAIIALIGANTQPSAQRLNAKNGSCDALQSPSCREGLKNDIVNPINQKIDAKTGLLAANQAGQDIALGVIATEQQAQKGVLAAIALKAKDIFDLIGKLWNNSLVDKAMQYITMITVIHNAVMLSRGIGDTLGSALDSGLQAFGLQIKDKDGNQLGVTQIIGKSFQNLIKSVIGAENYTALNATWTQANRVYQAGINLLGNVQAIVDSSTAVAELCSNRVGTLMNALRSAGMVREDAYRGQSQNVTKFNAFQNKLEALEQGVSNTASIAGSVVSVQQSVNELKTNRAAFDNAVKGEDGRTQTATEEKREESVFKIADFTIVRPPETTS